MNNIKIRLYASGKGVKLWELAKALGISEATLTRKMRVELSDDEQKQFYKAIDTVYSEREQK
jgi:hypothetical protein